MDAQGTDTTRPLLLHHAPVSAADNVKRRLLQAGFLASDTFKLGRLLDQMATGSRFVEKDGQCVVRNKNVDGEYLSHLRDVFNTLVDTRWRWCLLIFSTAYIGSWFIFSMIYFTIAAYRGDLIEDRPADWLPCITNILSFTSAFLYSVETQTTIGYGSKYTTDRCPEAIATMTFQSILGIMLHTFITGFVFAKMSRPEKRAATLIFSDKAVITMRDGKRCFLFRIGDMRKSHLIQAQIRLQMIKQRVTEEGEILPFHLFDMKVATKIFLVWPLTVVHVIDEDSPLYEYTAQSYAKARWEVVAILEGVVEARGMTLQARTSYLPNEVFWGYRFEKLVSFHRDDGRFVIDFDLFHAIRPAADTPPSSAKQIRQSKLGRKANGKVSSQEKIWIQQRDVEANEEALEDETDTREIGICGSEVFENAAVRAGEATETVETTDKSYVELPVNVQKWLAAQARREDPLEQVRMEPDIF